MYLIIASLALLYLIRCNLKSLKTKVWKDGTNIINCLDDHKIMEC